MRRHLVKKLAAIGVFLVFAAGTASAAGFRIEAKGSFFSSENAIFRDVYGSGAKLGLAGGLDLGPNISCWVETDYLHRTGKMTLTGEETKVTLTPLSACLRYELPAGEKFRFHVQAGIEEVFFNETNLLGTARENALGFVAGCGAAYRLSGPIGVGLFARWSTCSMTHDGVDFKVGGLEFGGAIELRL